MEFTIPPNNDDAEETAPTALPALPSTRTSLLQHTTFQAHTTILAKLACRRPTALKAHSHISQLQHLASGFSSPPYPLPAPLSLPPEPAAPPLNSIQRIVSTVTRHFVHHQPQRQTARQHRRNSTFHLIPTPFSHQYLSFG